MRGIPCNAIGLCIDYVLIISYDAFIACYMFDGKYAFNWNIKSFLEYIYTIVFSIDAQMLLNSLYVLQPFNKLIA